MDRVVMMKQMRLWEQQHFQYPVQLDAAQPLGAEAGSVYVGVGDLPACGREVTTRKFMDSLPLACPYLYLSLCIFVGGKRW